MLATLRHNCNAPDARYERVAVVPATAPGRHAGRGGSGSREKAKRSWTSAASPEGWTRWFGPLDAEGGRSKLRASGETVSAQRSPARSSARAGFEAQRLAA